MPFPPSPRAVVTGAGSGLGRALCQELACRGARLVASDVNLESVEATVSSLGPGDYHAVRCNVADIADVEALLADSMRYLGGVDLLINNAGVAVGGDIGAVPLASWRWIVDVNLWGPIHGCHVFVPYFRQQGSGHVLNVASLAGLCSGPHLSPYNTTKSAVVALTETLSGELAGTGVGASVLCPTFFTTAIVDSAQMHGDPAMVDIVRGLMAGAKTQAADVARIALDGAAAGDLYILPHLDGRIVWSLKRFFPRLFHRLTPRLLEWRRAAATKNRKPPAR